jgi:phosphate transport system permease protein
MAQVAGTPAATPPASAGGVTRRRLRVGDRVFRGSSLVIGACLILLLFVILGVLLKGGADAFKTFGLSLITGKNWNPVAGRQSFGALPFIFGTLVTSTVAVVLAVPISVGLALLLNEMPSSWLRNPLAVFVDLLAAIPSVVYGLWGFYFLVPAFDQHIEPFLNDTLGKIPVIGSLFHAEAGSGGNIFVAGVILAIMIVPIVTAVTREVVAIVPHELREGAMALGATRYEVIKMSVLPYARSGIVGATMLGLGRALGETIAVAMVIGNSPTVQSSLFHAGYTIPAVIANEFREASTGLHKSALLALALLLVVIALILAALSRLVVRRAAGAFDESGIDEDAREAEIAALEQGLS